MEVPTTAQPTIRNIELLQFSYDDICVHVSPLAAGTKSQYIYMGKVPVLGNDSNKSEKHESG
jgi:hypothetical protein